MDIKIPNIPNTWSHSRYGCWSKCPAQYKYRFIDKIPEPPSRAMERGNDIHAKGEQFLKGNIRGVPAAYKPFATELRMLKKLGAAPEESWSVTKEWKTCEWKDYGVVWLRGKTDVHIYFEEDASLSLIDFKSGRQYASHKGQAELYSVMGLSYYPEVKTIDVEFWYLDLDHITPFEYSVTEVRKLKKLWTSRANKMLKDRKFKATPGDACKWCNFHCKKGGPCKEGV